ncbi:MAG TPA: NAD(P)/FAD-dependent oxidoreductase [Candidatus Eisenbacteria bacterium]
MSQPFDVVVIGAGTNGLVAAAALGQAGLRVLVLERENAVGGLGRSVEFAPGFRAAPFSIDPGWLPPAVARSLGLATLERRSLDAPVSVAMGKGAFLTLWGDPARAAQTIHGISGADAARWPDFTARLARLAGFLEVLYGMPAPDVDLPPGEWLPMLGLLRRLRGLGRADSIELLRILPMSVWELLDDTFESDSVKAAVAPTGVMNHRQGPRSGATGFVLLHYLVGANAGVMRGRPPWRDGPDTFLRAVEAAARRSRVSIRTGAEVVRIEVRDDAVHGVVLASGEEIAARRVLSTADPRRTLLGWVDPVWLDPEFLHAVRMIRFRGCTAFVVYGIDGLPELPGLASPEALSGVVSLSPSLDSLERAADAAKYGNVPERPHVELTVPTLLAPGLAPEGKHVLVARVQYAPYRLRDGAVWDDGLRERLAAAVTRAIAEVIPCFSTRVLHQVAWSPRDLEERFALTEGAPTHGEMALDQILFMRPVPGWGRHAMPIDGLYLGGAGTHPGPGILGGSGWLAARRLLGDRGRR